MNMTALICFSHRRSAIVHGPHAAYQRIFKNNVHSRRLHKKELRQASLLEFASLFLSELVDPLEYIKHLFDQGSAE